MGFCTGARLLLLIASSFAVGAVATTNANNGGKPGLFRCNLDGTATALVDATAGRLLVVTENGASSSRPSLFSLPLW